MPGPVCSQLVERAGDREEMGRLWGAHGVVRETKLLLRGICISTWHFAMFKEDLRGSRTHIHRVREKERGNWKPFKGRRKINGLGICLE